MPFPELNVEKKLAIRNTQYRISSLVEQSRAVQRQAQEQVQTIQKQIQVESAQLRAQIEGFTVELGLGLDKVSFSLDTLVYTELTPNAPAPPAPPTPVPAAPTADAPEQSPTANIPEPPAAA
jgi:hypothetical protein